MGSREAIMPKPDELTIPWDAWPCKCPERRSNIAPHSYEGRGGSEHHRQSWPDVRLGLVLVLPGSQSVFHITRRLLLWHRKKGQNCLLKIVNGNYLQTIPRAQTSKTRPRWRACLLGTISLSDKRWDITNSIVFVIIYYSSPPPRYNLLSKSNIYFIDFITSSLSWDPFTQSSLQHEKTLHTAHPPLNP